VQVFTSVRVRFVAFFQGFSFCLGPGYSLGGGVGLPKILPPDWGTLFPPHLKKKKTDGNTVPHRKPTQTPFGGHIPIWVFHKNLTSPFWGVLQTGCFGGFRCGFFFPFFLFLLHLNLAGVTFFLPNMFFICFVVSRPPLFFFVSPSGGGLGYEKNPPRLEKRARQTHPTPVLFP